MSPPRMYPACAQSGIRNEGQILSQFVKDRKMLRGMLRPEGECTQLDSSFL